MNKLTYLFTFLILTTLTYGQRFPDQPNPPRLVNDFANILSSGDKARLEEKLLRYSDTTSTEIAVIIINTLNDEDPNLYAAELGEYWGVGRKGKDNGLVFLVAIDDRKMAIQNGYGLEGQLTDLQTKLIIEDYILPEFKKGNYYRGIDVGTNQIIKLLAGEFEGKGNRRSNSEKKFPFFIILIIILVIFSIFRKRGGGGRGGYRGGGGYWIGGVGGGGFGGSSGGGFGGGFGGFGGGSFGGGGASGSW